jgi:hypothetical protein
MCFFGSISAIKVIKTHVVAENCLIYCEKIYFCMLQHIPTNSEKLEKAGW